MNLEEARRLVRLAAHVESTLDQIHKCTTLIDQIENCIQTGKAKYAVTGMQLRVGSEKIHFSSPGSVVYLLEKRIVELTDQLESLSTSSESPGYQPPADGDDPEKMDRDSVEADTDWDDEEEEY